MTEEGYTVPTTPLSRNTVTVGWGSGPPVGTHDVESTTTSWAGLDRGHLDPNRGTGLLVRDEVSPGNVDEPVTPTSLSPLFEKNRDHAPRVRGKMGLRVKTGCDSKCREDTTERSSGDPLSPVKRGP